MKKRIYTIGHSTLPIDEFIDHLKAHDIRLLCDIRTIPRSRHNPQYNTEALEKSLKEAGLGYRHMAALGGLRKARADSPNTGWRNGGFRGYADYMQTEEFEKALEELIALSSSPEFAKQIPGRPSTDKLDSLRILQEQNSGNDEYAAIMCAEAVHWRCHRSLVADALVVRGITVMHIASNGKALPHRLTGFAQVEGNRITYPPQQASLPGL